MSSTPVPEEKAKHSHIALLDLSAIGISGLCLVHCLLLPAAFAALPILGQATENHLVHQVLVLIAIPVSVWALSRSGGWKKPAVVTLAAIGLGLLAAAAFIEPLEVHETLLSVTGALLVGLAHLLNWRRPLAKA
ncbi:MAG: MerC domain-containing protein [Asticcacaulis sp.]